MLELRLLEIRDHIKIGDGNDIEQRGAGRHEPADAHLAIADDARDRRPNDSIVKIDLRELPRSLRLRERCDGRLALRAKKADPLALRVERRARRRDPGFGTRAASVALVDQRLADRAAVNRSEEHTSELQSLMRISYA